MEHARVRFTVRLRLEPISARHAADLWRLFQDPAVAEWHGVWTLEMAQREVAHIGGAWQTDGVHKWMAHLRTTGALVGRGGCRGCNLPARSDWRSAGRCCARSGGAGLRDGDWPGGRGLRL